MTKNRTKGTRTFDADANTYRYEAPFMAHAAYDFHVAGMVRDWAQCMCCGKEDLKRAVMIITKDTRGRELEELYLGQGCANRWIAEFFGEVFNQARTHVTAEHLQYQVGEARRHLKLLAYILREERMIERFTLEYQNAGPGAAPTVFLFMVQHLSKLIADYRRTFRLADADRAGSGWAFPRGEKAEAMIIAAEKVIADHFANHPRFIINAAGEVVGKRDQV